MGGKSEKKDPLCMNRTNWKQTIFVVITEY